LLFKHFPAHFVALWSDKRKHIALATVFAHKRCGQPEAAFRLKFRRDAENWRGESMHFIVYDKSPIAFREQLEVILFAAAILRANDLVRRNSHGFDFFLFAAVFSYHFRRYAGLAQQFVYPLPHSSD
jgi:hypothetical protein